MHAYCSELTFQKNPVYSYVSYTGVVLFLVECLSLKFELKDVTTVPLCFMCSMYKWPYPELRGLAMISFYWEHDHRPLAVAQKFMVKFWNTCLTILSKYY